LRPGGRFTARDVHETGGTAVILRALLDGGEPPVAADWEELKTALQGSEPHYSTVEEAMTALRSRPWAKDV